MGSIVVCIDINNISETAVRFACLSACKQNHKLHIAIAIDGSHQNFLFGGRAISTQKRKQVEKNICSLLEKICQEFKITPAISISEGDMVLEIFKAIRTIDDCKLVVFGKSQSFGSDNSVLPKIIRYLGNKINVPVMIIPNSIDYNFFL
jgi:hypothetical protein